MGASTHIGRVSEVLVVDVVICHGRPVDDLIGLLELLVIVGDVLAAVGKIIASGIHGQRFNDGKEAVVVVGVTVLETSSNTQETTHSQTLY